MCQIEWEATTVQETEREGEAIENVGDESLVDNCITESPVGSDGAMSESLGHEEKVVELATFETELWGKKLSSIEKQRKDEMEESDGNEGDVTSSRWGCGWSTVSPKRAMKRMPWKHESACLYKNPAEGYQVESKRCKMISRPKEELDGLRSEKLNLQESFELKSKEKVQMKTELDEALWHSARKKGMLEAHLPSQMEYAKMEDVVEFKKSPDFKKLVGHPTNWDSSSEGDARRYELMDELKDIDMDPDVKFESSTALKVLNDEPTLWFKEYETYLLIFVKELGEEIGDTSRNSRTSRCDSFNNFLSNTFNIDMDIPQVVRRLPILNILIRLDVIVYPPPSDEIVVKDGQ
ncbi:hypothetical protein Dimus_035926 [Dionaea muscipula]